MERKCKKAKGKKGRGRVGALTISMKPLSGCISRWRLRATSEGMLLSTDLMRFLISS
jgi:hypothetical protein